MNEGSIVEAKQILEVLAPIQAMVVMSQISPAFRVDRTQSYYDFHDHDYCKDCIETVKAKAFEIYGEKNLKVSEFSHLVFDNPPYCGDCGEILRYFPTEKCVLGSVEFLTPMLAETPVHQLDNGCKFELAKAIEWYHLSVKYDRDFEPGAKLSASMHALILLINASMNLENSVEPIAPRPPKRRVI